MRFKIGIIGSGNWGSTSSKVIGENVSKFPSFHPVINMWVLEENVNGEKLSEIINTRHENVKYLPGIEIPSNVKAIPELEEVVRESSHLVFVLPHQFVESTCKRIKPFIKAGAVGISLIKGLIEGKSEINLPSNVIKTELGIHVSVLSGANIASEIAEERFSTTTIGCDDPDVATIWHGLFERPYFMVSTVPFTVPLEIFGAVKNCIALAVGFSEALQLGNNTRAFIIRKGFVEIIELVKLYEPSCSEVAFLQSFGLDDLITTCIGGRNVKAAELFIREKKPIEVIEKEILNGQKLQGPSTILLLYRILHDKGVAQKFPLMCFIHDVMVSKVPVEALTKALIQALRT